MTQEIRHLRDSSLQRLPSGLPGTVRRTWARKESRTATADIHVSALKEVTKDT